MSRSLQCIHNFGRRVSFVVLGQQFRCIKGPILIERAERHDSLSLAKQAWQTARVSHGNGMVTIRDDEVHRNAAIMLHTLSWTSPPIRMALPVVTCSATRSLGL